MLIQKYFIIGLMHEQTILLIDTLRQNIPHKEISIKPIYELTIGQFVKEKREPPRGRNWQQSRILKYLILLRDVKVAMEFGLGMLDLGTNFRLQNMGFLSISTESPLDRSSE